MKFLLSFCLFVIAALPLAAQHCGWDHAYVIILDVRNANGEKINGLDAVLANADGVPYTSEWNLENHRYLTFYQGTDTLRFGQNTKKSGQEFNDVRGPFSFCVDCYLLLVYFNNYPAFNESGTDLIVITDRDGKMNGGDFGTTRVSFAPENITSLCTSNAIWDSDAAVEKVKIKATLAAKR